MPQIWFIAGPPFDVALWQAVEARVHTHGLSARSWACMISGSGDISEEQDRLSADLYAAETPVVLVGHGSALPLVRAAAEHPKVVGLVLSNGPGSELDRLNRLWTRLFSLPRPLRSTLLGPDLLMPVLASPVGLRRTVVNPYVMDRDTVVAICGPIFEDPDRRERVSTYFKSLPPHLKTAPTPNTHTLLCWGDADPIGADTYSEFEHTPGITVSRSPIPGGRFMHPVERPWEIADRIVEWASEWAIAT